jgi:hypothetical protein
MREGRGGAKETKEENKREKRNEESFNFTRCMHYLQIFCSMSSPALVSECTPVGASEECLSACLSEQISGDLRHYYATSTR